MPAPVKAIDIPINVGNKPDWDRRLGYPNNLNMFVGDSDFLYTTAGLQLIRSLQDTRYIHYSPYQGGVYFAVTNTQIYRVTLAGSYEVIANIAYSGQAVQIAENLQYQVTIVDGSKAYVVDQTTAGFVTLSSAQGFTFATPCSVVTLNTFTVILDKATGSWTVSNPNNALSYPALDFVPQIESQLTTAVSLSTLGNNLFIFGSTGIERWTANYNTNVYLFPFSRDDNYRQDFGAADTAGVTQGHNTIYFLSSLLIPMVLTLEGGITPIGDAGMVRVISQYPDVRKCITSFYVWNGNYFCHFTFPETALAWVYCQNSKTWGFSDDLIVASVWNQEIVATNEGIYRLSLIPGHKHRSFQLGPVFGYKGQQTFRNTLNGVEVRLVQGRYQYVDTSVTMPLTLGYSPQFMTCTISLDSDSWLNSVAAPLGKTGKRNAITVWRTNLTGYEFTPRFDYYGDLELTVQKVTMCFR